LKKGGLCGCDVRICGSTGPAYAVEGVSESRFIRGGHVGLRVTFLETRRQMKFKVTIATDGDLGNLMPRQILI